MGCLEGTSTVARPTCANSSVARATLAFGLSPEPVADDGEVVPAYGPQGGSHLWVGASVVGLAPPLSYAFEARDAFSGARLGVGRTQGGCDVSAARLFLNGLFPAGAGLASVRVVARDGAGREASQRARVWIGVRLPACVPAAGVQPSLTPVLLASATRGREDARSLRDGDAPTPTIYGDALVGAAVTGFAASAVTLTARLYADTSAGRTLLSEVIAAPTTGDTAVAPAVRRAVGDCVAPATAHVPLAVALDGAVLVLTADDGLGHRRTEERRLGARADAGVVDAGFVDAPTLDGSGDAPADGTVVPDASVLDAAPGAAVAGLAVRSVAELSGYAHLHDLLVDGDVVYVADSNGLPVLRRGADGGLTVINPVAVPRAQHCAALALHRRSNTLLCVAADTEVVDRIDVSTPASPRSRPWSVTLNDTAPGAWVRSVPDLAVVGDTLWLATQPVGLVRATLGDDGTPRDLTRTGIGADVVGVAAGGGRLALLDRAQGLVVLSEPALTPLGRAALDGPPLDLALDGDRLAVALGSEGARVFEIVPGGLREVARVQPRCVASAVALSGDRLAVACLSGVTLYDLGASPPRVAGYHAARFGMLDVAFVPDGMLVSDWFTVTLLATRLDGVVTYPDVPGAMMLAPAVDARFTVRNPSQTALTTQWRLEGGGARAAQGMLTLPPSGDGTLTLPAALVAAAAASSGGADVVFTSDAAPGGGEARVHLLPRLATELPARGVVAVGDTFPTLRRTRATAAPPVLPQPGAPTTVMFLTVDCFLQWVQLEDMAWTRAHDPAAPEATVLVLTESAEEAFDPSPWLSLHGAAGLRAWQWADYARSVAGQEAQTNPRVAFEGSFATRIPGADFPHDFVVDGRGLTVDTVRMYRGRWPLVR